MDWYLLSRSTMALWSIYNLYFGKWNWPYSKSIGLDKQDYLGKTVIIFLPISFNICFGCSKEMSH